MVDYLADHDFEVETTQIIGSDLRMVEQVTGRLTWARALLSGAASGAWFGVFVGLLLSILHTTTLLVAMAWGLGWGIIFGAVFAAVSYGMTGGRRDFTSSSVTVPTHFQVLVLPRTAPTPALCWPTSPISRRRRDLHRPTGGPLASARPVVVTPMVNVSADAAGVAVRSNHSVGGTR